MNADSGEKPALSSTREALHSLSQKYRQLPSRERKFVISGGIVTALVLCWFFIAEPVYNSYRELKSEIPGLTHRVYRYRSVVNLTEDSKEKGRLYSSEFNVIIAQCFEGQTADIAAGKLAETVRDKASKTGLVIRSTKVEKPRNIPGFEQIGVSVSFNASLSELARFMQKLEQNRKAVVIREARIHAFKEDLPPDQSELLSVELLLSGLRYLP